MLMRRHTHLLPELTLAPILRMNWPVTKGTRLYVSVVIADSAALVTQLSLMLCMETVVTRLLAAIP